MAHLNYEIFFTVCIRSCTEKFYGNALLSFSLSLLGPIKTHGCSGNKEREVSLQMVYQSNNKDLSVSVVVL